MNNNKNVVLGTIIKMYELPVKNTSFSSTRTAFVNHLAAAAPGLDKSREVSVGFKNRCLDNRLSIP